MRLEVIGSGTCALRRGHLTACYLVEVAGKKLVFDLGNGALDRLFLAGHDYRELDHLHFSHAHPDHISDLLMFLEASHYTPGFHRTRPLHLTGPAHVFAYLDCLLDFYGQGFDLAGVRTIRHVLAPGEGYRQPHWRISAEKMNHFLPTLGYRLAADGKVFCYTGDTANCPEVVKLCQGADLAVMDCSALAAHGRMPGHLTAADCGHIGREAGAKCIVLSHTYPGFSPRQAVAEARAAGYQGELIPAKDGLAVTF